MGGIIFDRSCPHWESYHPQTPEDCEAAARAGGWRPEGPTPQQIGEELHRKEIEMRDAIIAKGYVSLESVADYEDSDFENAELKKGKQ